MTPEQRIAHDLGLDLGDLEQIVRHERAVRLAPTMLQLIRDLDAEGMIGKWGRIGAIIDAVDRPLSERRAS